MTRTLLHPDADQLAAYHRGLLDPEAAAAIDEHLVDCDRCCAHLDGLPDDPFFGLVRAADGSRFAGGSGDARTATFGPGGPVALAPGALRGRWPNTPGTAWSGWAGRAGWGRCTGPSTASCSATWR